MPIRGGSMSPGAVDLVEEEAFDRFGRLVSVEAAVFDRELLCHRVGQFFHEIFRRRYCYNSRSCLPQRLAMVGDRRGSMIPSP